MKTDNSEPRSQLTCCLITGVVGGIFLVAVLLIGAAVLGFLHFRTVGQQQLAEQQAVISEQMRARMQADMERGVLESGVGEEQVDPARLSDAIRLVPPAPTPRPRLEITVDRDGQVRSDGQIIDAGALQRMLHTEATAQGVPPQVLIRADKQCLFGHISAVLDTCREAGAQDIQLKAEPGAD